MKIRDGFVSNSSSSSFIVRLPPSENSALKGLNRPNGLLNEADLKKVLKFGFRPTDTYYASQLSPDCWEYREPLTEISKDTEQLGYCVSCNEDEVIEFLVNNNIPFSGSTHYGHSNVFFQRDGKTLLWLDNIGLSYEMYGHSGGAMAKYLMSRFKKLKPVRRESIKNYTEGNR